MLHVGAFSMERRFERFLPMMRTLFHGFFHERVFYENRHLTNRCSQPLARSDALACIMKTSPLQSTLAPASGS
jgi:hypothetical protein